MKKYGAEFIGTFALVFAGTGAIVINDVSGGAVTHVGVALTFGLIVLAMIYAVGDISGAHLNPAVTIGFFAARTLLRAMFPQHPTLGTTSPAGAAAQSLILEIVLTAFLMFVILNVSIGPKERGTTAGIAVGSVIALEALFAGPICGASMNPARSFAPALVFSILMATMCTVSFAADKPARCKKSGKNCPLQCKRWVTPGNIGQRSALVSSHTVMTYGKNCPLLKTSKTA